MRRTLGAIVFVVLLLLQQYARAAEKLRNAGLYSTQTAPKDDIVIHAATVVHKVSPKYPKQAKKEHVEGVVRLRVLVAKDGSVRDVSVISSPGLLTDAAMNAVRQWRYEPTLLNGEPVEVDTTIDVIFQLHRPHGS